MRTFAITTIGCKVNQYESQQIRELLEQFGLNQVETSQRDADLVVINSCCVTRTASAKSRQRIRKARKLNPDSTIVVCGCLPAIKTGELTNLGKNVQLISHRETIAETLSQIANGKTAALSSENLQPKQDTIIKAENGSEIKLKNKLPKQPKLAQLTSFKGHTRAFLKIQDGCDGYCSYCIVPKTRPVISSKSADAVLRETQALVEAGHKEIVLTGIFIGAYGQESVRRKSWPNQQNDKLADLLDEMVKIPNLARIRVSSLEPADVTPRLLDTFAASRKIMPHLHLSLQSGSNNVLKRMCRQYTADESREKIELIRNRLDRPAITTDIIVGFPGETDADFEDTVRLAKESGFAKIHVFSFSPRPGTAAASLQGTIDNEVIKERSRILCELDKELGYKFRQQFVGESAEILVENSTGKRKGRSERYFMVELEKAGDCLRQGEVVKVKLVKNSKDGMIGQVS
ncbi:MAG: tRNA (N(6)-L-threonylcarbamoyladenosine(37)-C(2))-methylthiotransferase MtaB [Phycisphaerae bacterium]|jgi:threonylcarbamoyladenosine tRNA methylthiotransferase MtaB